jgi:ribosomal peptide maturation radical SAM protein 1
MSGVPPLVRDAIAAAPAAGPLDAPRATQADRGELHVALIAMPFVTILRPSIQLGLLKAIADSHGFSASVFNFYLDFASQIEPKVYESISEAGRSFMGDWLFAAAAFGPGSPEEEEAFLDHYCTQPPQSAEEPVLKRELLIEIRRSQVTAYLDRLMASVDWSRFRVVGFTSTFQQNVASIALAVRLKQKYPSLTIVFGGSNCEGEMGVEFARSMACADYVFTGESDQAFPEFLIAMHEGRDPAKVPGVVCRRNGTVTAPGTRPPFDRLDELPTPDYDEFFERAEALNLLPPGPRREVRIPFESARGCWWGMKHHCTFCGLNGSTMTFRAKRPERVLQELRQLAGRYHSFMFTAVDNIIAPFYLKTLCADLTRERMDFDIFYEIKANLNRHQLKVLRDSGIRHLQPGIESLSTRILKLMDKGIRGIANVNTLRWSRYYGIGVGWNLLYGFPGEAAEDYEAQDDLLRKLSFLQPPNGVGRIWMERFSPIFNNRSEFPVRKMGPAEVYRHIYPPEVDLAKLAYFFDYELEGVLPDSAFTATTEIVGQWRKAWEQAEKPQLRFWSSRDFLQIEDARNLAEPGTYTFEGPLALIYAALVDGPSSAAKIKENLKLPWDVEEVEAALDEFCASGLMIRDDDLFLALALPATLER